MPSPLALELDGDAIVRQFARDDLRHARSRRLLRLHGKDAPAAMFEREADIGPRHGKAAHDVQAGGIFAASACAGICAAPELGEQIARPAPACRAAGQPGLRRPARHDRPPGASPARPRVHGFRASGARRWRSTAALRRESRASPTCSIASSGSFEVAWRSSARAISSGDMPQPSSVTSIRLETALGQRHRDPRRAGIDGIFDQFLERGGRTFDHFARGDAVDESFWKAANLRHLAHA